jgi:hypothetical protein
VTSRSYVCLLCVQSAVLTVSVEVRAGRRLWSMAATTTTAAAAAAFRFDQYCCLCKWSSNWSVPNLTKIVRRRHVSSVCVRVRACIYAAAVC